MKDNAESCGWVARTRGRHLSTPGQEQAHRVRAFTVEDFAVKQGGDDRHTFESFQVEPTNREAFERCCDVANMRPQSPQLLVLLGEQGAGKTHLLRAIVHRVRHRQVPAAIAAISDTRFPAEVRALAADPRPIDALPFAVLLIDGLERVSEEFDEVTQLIKTFLKLEFPVVVTLEAPLNNSSSMPDELKALLDAGRCEVLEPRKSGAVPLRSDPDPKDREIARLRASLSRSQTENTVSRQAARGLLERTEGLLRELEQNKTHLAEVKQSQHERLLEIREFETELTSLQTNASRLATPESGEAETDLDELQARFAKDQHALRQSFQATQKLFDVEIEDLRIELDKSREEFRQSHIELEKIREEHSRFENEAEQLHNETAQLKKVLVDVRAEREMAKARLKRAHDDLAARENKDVPVDANSQETSKAGTTLEEVLARHRKEGFASVQNVVSLRESLVESLKVLDVSDRPAADEDESSGEVSESAPSQRGQEPESRPETEPEDSPTPPQNSVSNPDVPPEPTEDAPSPSDKVRSFKPKMSLHHVEQLDDTLDIFSDDDI